MTDEGSMVDGEIVSVLQFMIQLRNKKDSPLLVPIHMPNIVEELAERYGRQVVRTKADMRSAMEGCRHQGFHVYGDAVYTMVQLMQMLADEAVSLSRLLGTFPGFALLREKVDCPWMEKGMVMRLLMEETKTQRVELIDGIKIFHESGWTLILPDNEEPVFQVFANAESRQAAKELAVSYTRKIQDYRERSLL